MNISLNGANKTVAATTVAELLHECGFNPDKIAVAINMEFIPRSSYAQHALCVDDKVDVLAPVQGG